MSWFDNPDALLAAGLSRDADLDAIAETRRATVQFDPETLDDTSRIDEFANQWRDLAGRYDPGPVGLGVRVIMAEGADSVDIAPALIGADVVDSVVIADKRLNRNAPMIHWPLRIGAGDDRFADGIAAYDHRHLIQDLGVVGDDEQADVVLTFDVARVFPKASAVIVAADALDLDLARSVGPNAGLVAVVGAGADPAHFVKLFLDEMSHNQTMDRAVGKAAREFGPYLSAGHPQWVERSRITSVVVAERAAAIEAAVEGHTLDLDAALGPLEALGGLGEEGFIAETTGATFTTDALEASRAETAAVPAMLGDEPSPAPAAPRHLQAQTYAKGQFGEERRFNSFEPGAEHRIAVRIGPDGGDWLSLPTPFPPISPPRDEPWEILTVHLIAPALDPEVQSSQMKLPVSGESSVVSFEGTVSAEADRFDGTIIVFRGTTHLQSGRLEGPIAAGDTGEGIRFLPGDASRVDLDRREDPDLALRLTTDEVWIEGRGPGRKVELPGIDQAVDPLKKKLYELAKRVEGLRIDLESPQGLELLHTLALQGSFLRERLFGDDALDDVASVEVTSPSSAAFLPVEFFYDHDIQDQSGVRLCGKWRTSVGPACTNCEAEQSVDVVCPSGFWAINRVVERQIRSVSDPDCVAVEPDDDLDVLPNPTSIIFASSDRVNTSTDMVRVDGLRETFDALRPTTLAKTWKEWRNAVTSQSPALLVALPHNVDGTAGFQALQLGDDKAPTPDTELSIRQVRPVYVGPEHIRPGPIALLLGCNTADPAVPFQDFVRQFRCKGASVVIGTLTYVLGQQAGPMAQALVDALLAETEATTVGEVMRSVRARMLRDDNPMGLMVAAYGAADWRYDTGGD